MTAEFKEIVLRSPQVSGVALFFSSLAGVPFGALMGLARFPGEPVTLVTVEFRALGPITPPGNPLGIRHPSDLTQAQVFFANRQPGSGTRVRLDLALRQASVDSAHINRFEREYPTHSAVARAVADGEANVGFGLQGAARVLKLEFIPFTSERFDLAIPARNLENHAIQAMLHWFTIPRAHQSLAALGGYDTQFTGITRLVKN